MKSPIASVKEKFGDKAKLDAELEKVTKDDDLWVSRTNKNKGLAHVSNAKLLKLHRTFSEVKEKFGSRAKLIDAILEVEKRSKDAGLRQKLATWPVPRLYDAYKSTAKRHAPPGEAKRAAKPAKAAAPAKAKKAAAAPKAAKKTAAKKA